MSPAKLEVGNTLQAARSEFVEHGGLILRLTLAFSILNAVSTLLDLTGTAGFAISTGITILLGAIYTGLITAMICLDRGDEDGVGELWASVKPVLARLIWVTLAYAAGVFLGLIALILPGLIVFTLWSVSCQVAVVERREVFASLGRSFEMVKGNAWQTFGVLAILGLLSAILLLLVLVVSAPLGMGVAGKLVSTGLGNFVSAPILAVAAAVLYNKLSELERRETAVADGDSPPDPGEG